MLLWVAKLFVAVAGRTVQKTTEQVEATQVVEVKNHVSAVFDKFSCVVSLVGSSSPRTASISTAYPTIARVESKRDL